MAKRRLVPPSSPPAAPSAPSRQQEGFVLGTDTDMTKDSMDYYTSSPTMPCIEVPSDSQFESSNVMDSLGLEMEPSSLKAEGVKEKDVTDGQEGRSLFQDVTAADSRHQKGHRGEGGSKLDAGDMMETYSSDLNSQSQDKDMQVLLEERRGRQAPQKDQQESPQKTEHKKVDKEQKTGQVAGDSVDVNHDKTPATTCAANNRSSMSINLRTTPPTTLSSSRRTGTNSSNRLSPGAGLHVTTNTTPFGGSPGRHPGAHHLPSPLSSVAPTEFVSPSRSISAEGYQELHRQLVDRMGKDVGTYELRYVRTICTVIEERVLSSELIENGTVVPGSEKTWPVSIFNFIVRIC